MQEATTPVTSSIPRTILRDGNGDCPYGRSEEMGPPGFHDSNQDLHGRNGKRVPQQQI